jgi:hypothetical protein
MIKVSEAEVGKETFRRHGSCFLNVFWVPQPSQHHDSSKHTTTIPHSIFLQLIHYVVGSDDAVTWSIAEHLLSHTKPHMDTSQEPQQVIATHFYIFLHLHCYHHGKRGAADDRCPPPLVRHRRTPSLLSNTTRTERSLENWLEYRQVGKQAVGPSARTA